MKVYEMFWPELEDGIKQALDTHLFDHPAESTRSDRGVLEEILELVRGQQTAMSLDEKSSGRLPWGVYRELASAKMMAEDSLSKLRLQSEDDHQSLAVTTIERMVTSIEYILQHDERPPVGS